MGKVADDLERLGEEVRELREERADFLKELEANEATRREEAEEARAEREAFVSGLEGDVGEMLDGFRGRHAEMAGDLRETLDANEATRKEEAISTDRDTLCRQLAADFDRLHVLVLEYANGNMAVKRERDQLQAKVTRGMRMLGRMEAGQRIETNHAEHPLYPFG